MAYFVLDDQANIEHTRYNKKKENTIIDVLNEVLLDLNYVYSNKDILYLNMYGIKNKRMLLNKKYYFRIEMEKIIKKFRTKNNKKAYLYFTNNKNHIGQFSICVSLVENHSKIEIYNNSYIL